MTEQRRKLGIRERSCGLLSPPQPQNHKGVGVLSASAHGNMASDWSCSPQSPPQIVEIKSGTGVWAT